MDTYLISDISFIRMAQKLKRGQQAPTLPLPLTSLSPFSPHCSALLTFWP